jgi:hypothetical protein
MILNILLNLDLRQTLLFPPGVRHDSPQIIFIILQGRLSFKKQPLGLCLLFLNLLLEFAPMDRQVRNTIYFYSED